MWVVLGVLLGMVVAATAVGFHTGPHGHLAAVGLGVAAATWMVVMVATGRSEPVLWVLFGADVALSASLGVLAWRGLSARERLPLSHTTSVLGKMGVAVTPLDPNGLVRVRGEEWSARSLNGPVGVGTPVQVIEEGVRLGVWAEPEPNDEVDSIEAHVQPSQSSGAHDQRDED
jgi:membrane-bound ClpP family serine protease